MWRLLSQLASNLGYVVLIAFTMSRSKIIQRAIQHKIQTKKDILIVSILFSLLGMIGTYLGINYNGAIVNIRNVSIVAASITCGPIVGGIAGAIASLHRLCYGPLIGTTIPCAIGTLLAGILPGLLYKKYDIKKEYAYGIFSTIFVESISMFLIAIMVENGREIINGIYVPMVIINSLGILLVMTIIKSIFDEKERLEGEQARKTLEITNKTLPYFKEVTEESLKKVCEIIRSSIDAQIVILTDKEDILAYSSQNSQLKLNNRKIVSDYTKKVLKNGETAILKKGEGIQLFSCIEGKESKAAIITPLIYDSQVIGTLKVYFNKENHITEKNKHLVIGLAKLISYQIQIGKIKKYKEMADKAEIKALQTQINPHFLFNSLHTITSFVRINPDRARELIVNLSDYLRYNLEVNGDMISLRKEIEQVKAYVSIVEARFGDKIKAHYEISEEDMDIKIPPLTIEPLIENAIKHGILKKRTGENIWIRCDKYKNGHIIVIEDDGCGIDKNIIDKVYNGQAEENRIGLYNVHCRMKLIYGRGLKIERLDKGTRISFEI